MLLRIKAIRKQKEGLEQRDTFLLPYNNTRKQRRAGVEQNLAGPLQMGAVEAAARCSHGQLAAQEVSTPNPPRPNSCPSLKAPSGMDGSQWDGPRREVS